MPFPPRYMFFADGENLVMRFQAMVKDGWVPRPDLRHEKDIYVWASSVLHDERADIIRASYYTTVVSDDDRLTLETRRLQSLQYTALLDRVIPGAFHARVFKKAQPSYKVRSVDINITIDVLRHTYNDDVDVIGLATGDSDFLPLIRAVMERGKRVIVYAFSSGLDRRMETAGDNFITLDRHFFVSEPPVA